LSRLRIPAPLLTQIKSHAEAAYPEEGAGFLLGTHEVEKVVRHLLPLPNSRSEPSRRTRYLIGPREYLRAESIADGMSLSILGVFHSHPDHPDQPSEFDREWAQPLFSYVITSVQAGRAVRSSSWLLAEDRAFFLEEPISTEEGA